MEITLLSYFLASSVSYLGLLIGIVLIRMAPEEQKPGRKYFIILRKLLFFLILIPPMYFYRINILFSLALLAFVAALMLGNKLRMDKSNLVYLLLGIIFAVGSKTINLFVIESTLIFLYGIPNASVILNSKKKNYHELLSKNMVFFIPVVALYIIF